MDSRSVWLYEHVPEMAELFGQVRERGLTRTELTDVTVERVMAMTPPPPGGEATALFIAQILWASVVAVPVPDGLPEWIFENDPHAE